jgi:osmoprotectant transport system permease protein
MNGGLLAEQGPDSFIWWAWVADHTDDIVERGLQHLALTSMAIGIGFVLAVVLSVVALRFRATMAPITWGAGILYAIPSLALFGFLVPITGASVLTAEIALVSYCLLILIQNVVAGIDGVPASVRDAADGMGYTPARRFLRIELPLALPEIITGLRVATVTVIGLVTVTALIGHGGFGAFINDGLDRSFSTPIVVGIVGSVALALVADLLFVLIQHALTPWTRRSRA